MSLTKTTETGTNNYELEITVDAETFEEGMQRAYRKEVKKIAIPGFRKGKAPRKFIEKAYGEGFFFEGAVNNTYAKAMDEAIKESKLKVIPNSADVKINDVDKNGYTFTVTLNTFPVGEIADYLGIEVEKQNEEVTDEDMQSAIDLEREKVARIEVQEDRKIEDGDIAVIDFKGFVDDEAFEGGESEDYPLTIGSKQFIDGFEEQLIGHSAGEEFDINVKFPDDYQAENLKGKDAVFKIKIKEVKVKQLPELDDEFVKDISEFDTVDEYKADLKEKLAEKKKNDAKAEIENKVSDKLIELLKAEIPEVMFENKIDECMRDFEYRLRSQGLDMNMYMKYMGADEKIMRDNFRKTAINQVKLRLALETIAKLEKIEVDDEAIEEEYKRIAENYKMNVENIKMFISKEMLKEDLAVGKAMDKVKEAVKFV